MKENKFMLYQIENDLKDALRNQSQTKEWRILAGESAAGQNL